MLMELSNWNSDFEDEYQKMYKNLKAKAYKKEKEHLILSLLYFPLQVHKSNYFFSYFPYLFAYFLSPILFFLLHIVVISNSLISCTSRPDIIIQKLPYLFI